MLVCAIAAKAPTSIEPTDTTQMICCHWSTSSANGPIRTRTNSTTAAIFGATAKNAVTSVAAPRSEEHTSEIQQLMRISYDVFWLKKKIHNMTTSLSNQTL